MRITIPILILYSMIYARGTSAIYDEKDDRYYDWILDSNLSEDTIEKLTKDSPLPTPMKISTEMMTAIIHAEKPPDITHEKESIKLVIEIGMQAPITCYLIKHVLPSATLINTIYKSVSKNYKILDSHQLKVANFNGYSYTSLSSYYTTNSLIGDFKIGILNFSHHTAYCILDHPGERKSFFKFMTLFAQNIEFSFAYNDLPIKENLIYEVKTKGKTIGIHSTSIYGYGKFGNTEIYLTSIIFGNKRKEVSTSSTTRINFLGQTGLVDHGIFYKRDSEAIIIDLKFKSDNDKFKVEGSFKKDFFEKQTKDKNESLGIIARREHIKQHMMKENRKINYYDYQPFLDISQKVYTTLSPEKNNRATIRHKGEIKRRVQFDETGRMIQIESVLDPLPINFDLLP